MPRSNSFLAKLLPDRLRATFGRRAVGIGAALLAELLLVLLLLTLAPDATRPKGERRTVFDLAPQDDAVEVPEKAAPEPERPQVRSTTPEPTDPAPDTPAVDTPAQPAPPPPVIALTPEQLAAADIATIAPAPSPAPRRGVAGPPNVGGGGPADTPRVEGSGPNGEPLYAAAWYREPYPEELRGYLSTAQGPGWGLIACRTVRDYRVEDCIALGESPPGSNIARSVLAAAWQFKVRPPRIGGESKVGEWVRIRIDYDLRRN